MILCCGEALIDMVPVEGADGQTTYAPLSGGAVFNTAIGLGRLEVPVQFLSGVSSDLFGEQLVQELQASDVGTDLLIRSRQPTTLAFVKLINGHAQYTFYDENSAGRMIEPADIPDIGDGIDALYFGGISLCAEPAASAYESLALDEAAHKVIIIDPNIRIGFIEDEQAYRARLDRMISVANIIKISDEDLDWIVSNKAGLEEKIETLFAKGAGIVVLTKGSDGSSAYVKGQDVVSVGVPKVTVVDTVGAGDTFNSGFLAKLSTMGLLKKEKIGEIDGAALLQALQYAAKTAGVTVSRAGANPPSLAELEALS